MLQVYEEQFKNVIQVGGITCVGVPISSPAFVTAFVKDKTSCRAPGGVLARTASTVTLLIVDKCIYEEARKSKLKMPTREQASP